MFAQAEIIKFCELMIPDLMMDFLLENAVLVDREAAAEWASALLEKDEPAFGLDLRICGEEGVSFAFWASHGQLGSNPQWTTGLFGSWSMH